MQKIAVTEIFQQKCIWKYTFISQGHWVQIQVKGHMFCVIFLTDNDGKILYAIFT